VIQLNSDICGRFESASTREWLETNGIGGNASSSVSGANTRRYHGLLVAATKPPLGRIVMLSKLEETVVIDGERVEISTNQYAGGVHPEGYRFLKQFRLDPFPTWTFEINNIVIEKTLFMIHGANATVCQWKIVDQARLDGAKCEIEMRPLLAFRDHHHLTVDKGRFCGDYEVGESSISIQPFPELPSLYLAHNAASVEPEDHWYHNFEYAIERERGFDFREDLYQPFSLTFDLADDACIIASTQHYQINDIETLRNAEISRRANLIELAGTNDEFSSQLVLAADQFIVARGTGKTVIAGYHWFSDWGRDTMIALNGLTLATNRPEIAKSILIEFSMHISQGMIPNRFPDAGETPDYNSVDATLWFFEAIRAYVEKTGDYELVRHAFYEKLVDIIDWHHRGTRFQIHVDTDGLLFAGEPNVQLTWMDAKIGDWVVTPRTGKAVEIQALWYNALRIMADFAKRFGDSTKLAGYLEMSDIVCESFNGQFWNRDSQWLFDVINGDGKDASLRPNQIFAASLPHTMLTANTARKVVDRVQSELLTPTGLRSLSPLDARYVSHYLGSPMDRDAGYHQGTVWGWLIGPFVDAYLRVHADDPDAKRRAIELIGGFGRHMNDSMVGQISEIFDGDQPHAPRGCAAQAWSVAELLRIRTLLNE